jgi:hypothetical protein
MSPKQRVARPVRAPRAACWRWGRHAARASAPLVLGVQPMPAGGSTYCTPTRCFRAARRSPPSRTPPRCSFRLVLLRPVARRFALSHSALSYSALLHSALSYSALLHSGLAACDTPDSARSHAPTRWTPPCSTPARWTPPRCSCATRRTPTSVPRPTRWSAYAARRRAKSSAL